MNELLAVFAIAALCALLLATLVAALIGRFDFPLPAADRRIGCIDGLRGYLALAVMLHHFFIWTNLTRMGGAWAAPEIDFLNQLGAGGVGLFFMTTGLVFYPRMLKGLRKTPWLTVYITRVFRIVPLVAVSVLIVTLIIMARTGARPDVDYLIPAARWIATLSEPPLLGYADSGRINAYVLWSLKFEWLFYVILLPICAAAMDVLRWRGLPSWTLPVAFLVVTVGARLGAYVTGSPAGTLQFLPLFGVGMLAFECQSSAHIRAVLMKPGIGIIALAGLLIGMALSPEPYGWSLPLFGFFFIVVACGNDIGGLLRNRGALILGECSFGIYLLHGIVLDLLFVDLAPLHAGLATTALPILLPAVGIVVVLVTATTYLLIEKPAMAIGRSLSHWVAGRRVRLDSREIEVAP